MPVAKPLYKVGQQLFYILPDHDKGTFETCIYEVRTIRGGRVYAIMKDKFTWGKLSKKNGDFGWLDKFIRPWQRSSWKIDSKPFKCFVSKADAWKEMLDVLNQFYVDEPHYQKMVATATRMIAQCDTTTKKKTK